MCVAKVGSAWEKIGRAGLHAAVQQKPAGGGHSGFAPGYGGASTTCW